MAAERCRVAAIVNGVEQFYQRESEQKRDGRWVAVPFFVIARTEAVTLPEAAARLLIDKIRSAGWRDAIWIEDASTGRRIDHNVEVPQSGEDLRQPMLASLNVEGNVWYVVKPICRPDGRKWFISIPVPGFPTNTVLYADDPIGVLQRAQDLGFLKYAEKYQRPPEPLPATPISKGPRLRPGALR